MSCSSIFYLAAFFYLLLASSWAAPGEKSPKEDCRREKRDAAGLFPFPRVGKSFPFTWSFNPGLPFLNMINPESGDSKWSQFWSQNAKREQLIPFPRIGKSGPKRNGASGGGGLWFGPRLGRMSKRSMELVPVAYRQENNLPEILFKSVLKNPAFLKNLGNPNDIEDYMEAKQ